MLHVCLYYTYIYTVVAAPCSPVIARWERANLLALLILMLPCVFATLPYGVSGQVCYLGELILHLCLLYFKILAALFNAQIQQILHCLHSLNVDVVKVKDQTKIKTSIHSRVILGGFKAVLLLWIFVVVCVSCQVCFL